MKSVNEPKCSLIGMIPRQRTFNQLHAGSKLRSWIWKIRKEKLLAEESCVAGCSKKIYKRKKTFFFYESQKRIKRKYKSFQKLSFRGGKKTNVLRTWSSLDKDTIGRKRRKITDHKKHERKKKCSERSEVKSAFLRIWFRFKEPDW